MSTVRETIDELCVDTIRTLAIDAVQKANSGHPGLPLGAAPMAYVLWSRHLKHNPRDPGWPDRDRFVLSAGHGCMLWYCLLHLTGYDLTMEDLKSFRQWGSRTPGHPEYRVTPGVEATTGPLGQGTANAVGMAMVERFLAHRFNRPRHEIVDHRTFAIVSDGDLMEGISNEASSLAGHLGLSRLTFLYDSNLVSLDGPTSMAFTEDVGKRYEAYGWQVLRVEEGNTDLDGIDRALAEAQRETRRPTLIIVRTTIGYGSPNKAGTAEAHGSPLGPEEVVLTKRALGWEHEEPFFVPEDALAHFREAVDRGARSQSDWAERFDAWGAEYPDLAREWRLAAEGKLPDGWDADLPGWKAGEKEATRVAAGKALNAIAAKVPWLFGGDADLSVSTNTKLKNEADFDGRTGAGRNVHFGVRELAMAGIANGMAYHGGTRPFVATFFCFSDYMRPSVRLAAVSELPVVFVWTHDSIGLGEDGPTHQPVEHLMSLRAMPGFTVIRPADPNEATEAWRVAMERMEGPVGLVLSRQKLPVFDPVRYAPPSGLARGAYVLAEASAGEPKLLLLATGSEVALALEAREKLEAEGVPTRVISMPSWEIFEEQGTDYRDEILPPTVRARLSIEAGSTLGWKRYVGDRGDSVGLDRFGASAPGEVVLAKLGFNVENVVAKAKALLGGR
ncbi:MAG: transketolase [Acidobacteriota bacterium]|nr:transketolase [Acidobacteriota bacterium]MDQ5871749.1 transketolase [Acidobacteriota bacterium]